MKKYLLSLLGLSIISGSLYFFIATREPLVSVVMPTYNRVKLLPRSIDSILNQTYKNFEFIIVDDASTDGSKALLESYAKKDPRIKIIYNEQNKGISYSRNRGTDAAKGKYIAIMDSDDYSFPERIKKHVDYLEKNKDVIALTALYFEEWEETGKTTGPNNWVPPHRFDFIFHLKNYFTNISVFRRDFVKKHNIRYNENMMSSEDYDFWSQIFMNGGKLRMLNEPLISLRRHQTNSQEYYDQIKSNSKITSNKLLRHFGISEPEKLKTDCERMLHIVKVNNVNHKLDEYTTNLFFNRTCIGIGTPKNGLYIKHNKWVDYLLKTDKKDVYRRIKNGDEYKILEINKNNDGRENIFVIENPDGDMEIYHKQQDESLTLLSTNRSFKTFIKDLFKY